MTRARPWLAGVVLLAGCATTATDDRPPTTSVVTKEILAPTCGVAQCHSAFARARGYELDTVAGVDRTLLAEIVDGEGSLVGDATAPADQPLGVVLHRRNGDGLGDSPDLTAMPLDAPMPEPDIQLVLAWLARGTPGSCAIPDGQICAFAGHDIATCGDDHEYRYRPALPGECP